MTDADERARPARDTPGSGQPRWLDPGLRDRLSRLPPGHPSSPWAADGTRRPPPPDLRTLELPLPGDPDCDEDDGRAGGNRAAGDRDRGDDS